MSGPVSPWPSSLCACPSPCRNTTQMGFYKDPVSPKGMFTDTVEGRVRLTHTLRGEPNPQQCFTVICLLISVHLEGLCPRCTDRKQLQDGGNLALKAGPPRWGLPVPRPGTSWTLLGSSSAETGTRCVKPPPIRSGWSLPREVTQGDNSDRLRPLSYGIDQDSGKSKVTFLRSFQPQGTWSTKRKTPAQRVKMSFPLIS